VDTSPNGPMPPTLAPVEPGMQAISLRWTTGDSMDDEDPEGIRLFRVRVRELHREGGAGPWQYFDSESQTLKASLDDSPRPIFVPTTECVVHRVKNKAAYQVCVAAHTYHGWGSWSAASSVGNYSEAAPKFCTSADFATQAAFDSYSKAILRPGMPVRCREMYRTQLHTVPVGAVGLFKSYSDSRAPAACVEWQDEVLGRYWVDFRNIELDTEADHVDKTPLSDLSSALELAELAVNQLGRTMQVVEARERLSLDDMLNELDAKLNAALNED